MRKKILRVKVINQAFKKCQSQYEDRVKNLMDSENLGQRAAHEADLNSCAPCIERPLLNILLKRCCCIIFQVSKDSV